MAELRFILNESSKKFIEQSIHERYIYDYSKCLLDFYRTYSSFGKKIVTDAQLLYSGFYPDHENLLALNLSLEERRCFRTISRWFGETLGLRSIPMADLIAILGFNLTDVYKWCKIVKRKNYSVSLVGVGGTGTNFIQWLAELVQMFDMDYIFERGNIYDNDNIEFHNLFRFPHDIKLSDNFAENIAIPKIEAIRYFYPIVFRYFTKISARIELSLEDSKQDFLYGAPGIATRKFLSRIKTPFFCATHGNQFGSLTLNPVVDENLLVESYGKIELTDFFMNQLAMVITTIKYLAEVNKKDIPKTTEKVIGTFNFFQDIKLIYTHNIGGIKECDKYNFIKLRRGMYV
jgi:hypothetical protein